MYILSTLNSSLERELVAAYIFFWYSLPLKKEWGITTARWTLDIFTLVGPRCLQMYSKLLTRTTSLFTKWYTYITFFEDVLLFNSKHWTLGYKRTIHQNKLNIFLFSIKSKNNAAIIKNVMFVNIDEGGTTRNVSTLIQDSFR